MALVGLKIIVAAAVAAGLPPFADTGFDFRLSPGPRNVGTRAESSGSGQVHAELSGGTLTLEGRYQGLLGAPTAAELHIGPMPGVRGPKFADLTVASAADGTIKGSVHLDSRQAASFRKGGFYIEIDSARAPEGDLWGWILPPSQ